MSRSPDPPGQCNDDRAPAPDLENSLRESEERYRGVFEAETDAIFLVDSATEALVDANHAALELYGYTLEEIRRITSADISAEPEKTHLVISEQHKRVPLRWHRRKDGTVFPVEITLSFFETRGRKYHVAAIRDLTAQRRMEEALSQAEEQLRHAQKMEAIGQLAGGVAHDFNNILAGVLMYLGLLQLEPAMDPSMKASLKELEKDVLRGTALTRQLLAFSRRQAMELSVVDLKGLLQGLLKMLHRLLGEHIELSLVGPDGLPPAEADPSMLEQVVINLCVNARDAMPQGGPLILRVAAVDLGSGASLENPEAREGRFLRLSVSDSGSGMSKETLQHVFEPFFTTKGVGRGTGLGLATVHGIVKQHRGWMEVRSELGRGSTFSAYLPAFEGKPSVPAETRKAAPAPGVGETVLVVEDEERLRAGIIEVLQRHAYLVVEAANGPDSLRQWRRHIERIDLVVTDMVMPGGMNGREVVERMREDRPGLKAIICTGYTDEPMMPGRAPAGLTTFLRKPFDMPHLLAVVRQRLDEKRHA
jgi:PAS domain S-box-containing protein